MPLAEHWPLFGLRITTPRLELRIPVDEDLDALLDLVRDGIHDPRTTPFATPWTDARSPALEQGALQYWWRSRSEVSATGWDLTFAVAHAGQLVGVQSIAAQEFPALRTAETGSWLGLAHQGKGIGKEMRLAVLHLAFEHMGAQAVTSGAFADNTASQRVSATLGYEPNGTVYVLRRGRRDEQYRYVLTRERWEQVRPVFPISVEGFGPCRPQLGLEEMG